MPKSKEIGNTVNNLYSYFSTNRVDSRNMSDWPYVDDVDNKLYYILPLDWIGHKCSIVECDEIETNFKIRKFYFM
jgi:hypothetical protein